MKIVAYIRANQSTTNDRVFHFAKALGAEVTYRENPVRDCDLAIQAGFQISPAMQDAMARDIPIIILENPVWGKSDGIYTWAYNGLGGLGFVPKPPDEPRAAPELSPWREWHSGQITIFGQVPNDKALRGADINEWARTVKKVVPSAKFRPHPITIDQRFEDVEPFEDVMGRTSLAITYSSTVGAQAVIAGVPTVAMHEGSLAWDMATHTLSEAPRAPERAEWLHALSYRHIGDSVPVQYVLGGYEEARDRASRGLYDNMSNGRPQ